MAEVKILLEGYSSVDSGDRACSTVTLVRDDDIIMVIDPGTLSSKDVLLNALQKENLTIEDITIVGLTHSHIDHFKYVGMFPNAKVLEYWGWWDNDIYLDRDNKVSENIEIVKTPGHSHDSITFLVKTKQGVIAICGDVFWKENFPKKDLFAQDLIELEKSRKKVLEISDYIIPGHGKMFKV